MIYYTNRSDTDAPRCASVDADDSSKHSDEGMTYRTHHKDMDDPHCVYVGVSSEDPSE
jgi:hypothetical protein